MHPRRYARRVQSKPELIDGYLGVKQFPNEVCLGSGHGFFFRRLSRCKRRAPCPVCHRKFWLLSLEEDLDYGFDGDYFYVRRIPQHLVSTE